MRKLLFCLAITTTALATNSAASAAEVWRTAGFELPESVLYDAANSRLIVSNIVGDPMAADGNGTLSLLGTDGKVIDEAWVTGLDAPKGSAIVGDKLVVADIGALRIVDLATGEFETIAIPDTVLLNDVTAGPDGTVYISDTFGNAIYTYKDGVAELFVQDPALLTPNGLLVDGNNLVVASLGTLAEDPTQNKPGGIFTIDLATKAITKDEAIGDFGLLDGIVKIGDAWYVSDNAGGKVFRVTPGAAPEAIATLTAGTADIGTDGTDIYVPQMMEGEILRITTAP